MAKTKNFEENMEELEEIIRKLESGDVPLDDAIDYFTQATKLMKVCDEKLKGAEEQINKILTEDGTLKDFQLEKEEN